MYDDGSRVGARVPTDRTLPPRRSALLDCDLVMKGGVTSGVVYPKAVARVAREYQVRNVGGTSVGAIAAAMVAAAEYERQKHADPVTAWDASLDAALTADLAGEPPALAQEAARPGYAGLYEIPDEVGQDLPDRFQPQPATRSLFHYLFSWIQKFDTAAGKVLAASMLGLWWPRIIAVIVGVVIFGGIRLLDPTAEGRMSLILGSLITIVAIVVIRRFGPPLNIPIGVVAGIAVVASLLLGRLIWSLAFESSWAFFAGLGDTMSIADAWDELVHNWDSVLVDVVPLVVVFWVAGAIGYLVWAVLRLLPKHDYGLCTGLGDARSITNWMHASLNRVADLKGEAAPTQESTLPRDVLTFGHLERFGIPESEEHKGRRGVRLAMIGTDIRRGVPLVLPDALSGAYLFDPEAFRAFFPEPVVRALVDGGEPHDDGRLRHFPPKERIPVVVPTRMSMSFPILFGAVPVHYRDGAGTVWPTWISDGGICSNFPSNLFDQPLPPWPTFGIDLIDAAGDPKRIPADEQYMRRWLEPREPYSRSSETENPERLPTQPLRGTQAFLMSAVNAARGWIDNSQKRLPGFAERIVAVSTYPGEGGLNIDMDHEKVRLLSRRGLLAVDHLLRQWRPETEPSQWTYHRWVRMRTLMRELEEVGRQWKAWYTVESGPLREETFEDMARAMPDGAATATATEYPYPIVDDMDRARAQMLVARFSAFAERTDYGLGRPGKVARAGENLGENAEAIVFDAPDSPSPNPTLLLMPPME